VAARALYALNRFGEATGHADRAVEIWDAHGSTLLELGEALLISARMRTLRADPDAARAKALRALDVLEPLGPSHALALCYSTLCAQDVLQARFGEAATWSRRALELAPRVGATDVVAHALGYRGLAKTSVGDPSGVGDLKRAVETADRLDHGDYLTVAADNLAVVLIRSGRVREAKPYLDVAERAAREHALDTARFRIEGQQCHV
jgi:tetratricopeptide (TPR) repeat protein